ncbi:MAG: SUF system NifU family Fe-S cluster assembly protein [Fimbriimonadales bacterium]|nr:SUF system NifU family Fe-S cluster assembly protein [Fimbriimonadales bacterium]
MLNELYQEIILDHYRQPRGRGELAPPKITQEGFNPSCGDEVIIDLRVEDGRIVDVRFHGQGCSISQASASMMTEAVKGKTLEEAYALIQRATALVKGELEGDMDTLGDIVALAGVRNFPVRVKCATLAWHTLEEALRNTA